MRLEEKFQELKETKEGAYMAHIYYGDPTAEFSIAQIDALVANGADIIEFGIPFSDPTADGPVFQAACERAIEGGITPKDCIAGIRTVRAAHPNIPIIVTTYYNIPYVYGIEEFMGDIADAGAQALIIPNLPLEEANPLLKAGKKAGIHVIFLVTPTTTNDRLKRIIGAAYGFIYVVNTEGVTGARQALADSTLQLIARVRKYTSLPIMAGFGVSKRKHAKALVAAGADGVITGSAVGKIYECELANPNTSLPKIAEFARAIKDGCNGGKSTKPLNRRLHT